MKKKKKEKKNHEDKQTASSKTKQKTVTMERNLPVAVSSETKNQKADIWTCNLAFGEKGTRITVLVTAINPFTNKSV
jgi:hypothetical protein